MAGDYTYHYSDTEDTREITMNELAEEQLADLYGHPGDCQPQLKRRLRDAVG